MFRQTRLKLTAWYLVIIMAVSLIFSAIIYRVMIMEVYRFARVQRFRIESHMLPLPPVTVVDWDLIVEARRRILIFLVFINTGILASSTALGYFLAGRTLKPIQDMLDSQNRFISDASHELKTPLASLKTAMEVYLRGKPNLNDARTLINESIVDVDKLQTLSHSLLILAKSGVAENQLSFSPVSLSSLIGQAIRNITPMAKAKQITIRTGIRDTIFMGDFQALVNLLVILLDNAIKYSPQDSSVTVQGRKKDGSVIIMVADRGPGIPAGDLPHIFDRFYRADTARTKSGSGGFGLGLSIAQQIAASHRGTITVSSKLKSGSTFSVRLPSALK